MMPTRRMSKVWSPGAGWIAKQQEQAATYENMGDGWPLLIALFRMFPDWLADILRSDNADFELSLIQRVFMRSKARYQYVDIDACRGATKSFCDLLVNEIEMALWPGQIDAIVGPSYKQTAKIASQIHKQVENNYPALTRMVQVDAESIDRFELSTPYGSKLSIAAFRGNTIYKVTAEEIAQETPPPFDAEEYAEVVIPAVRGEYKVNGKRCPAYTRFKQHSITSAGRRQSYAYETRRNHRMLAARGESAFVIDVPFDVILLEQMRPVAWAENIRNELTPGQWLREMESVYSGSDKNPIVRDELLAQSRSLLLMEEHHCCNDRDNKLRAEDVIYVVGYDVSYRDAKQNAKCAVSVLKLTKQNDFYHRDKYLKQQVWVEDWTPGETPTPIAQARRLKHVWSKYVFDGSQTYIALDAWQYGDGVLTALMDDLGDGLAPLCCYEHSQYTELEREGAIPVIYPIKAGGVGTTDPDSEMVLNMERQFEYGNIQLLTGNLNEGVEAYKRYHRIKDDEHNYKISQPYKKTAEQVGQIQNLREVPSGAGISEKRISNHIQRDSWSALKYAGRFAQLLERSNLQKRETTSDWDALLRQYKDGVPLSSVSGGSTRMIVPRIGGRIM